MKRIVQFAVLAALACGAQAAWAEDQSQESISVAQASSAEERRVAREAQPAPKPRNLLQELGLATDGPFPSRGGPIGD